jgi:hypothetical protein
MTSLSSVSTSTPSVKNWFVIFFSHIWVEAIVVLAAIPIGTLSGLGSWEMVKLSLLLIGQNISFTFVSRARQMASVKLHIWTAIGSNGFYILVITTVVAHYNNPWLKIWYIVCTVVGSVHAHYLSLHKIEKSKTFKGDSLISRAEFEREINELKKLLANLQSQGGHNASKGI